MLRPCDPDLPLGRRSAWPRCDGVLPRFQAARRQPNNRAGRKSTALTNARRASKVIPSKRNGSATSQTIGKSTNASRASGHERTRRIHHPTKRISVFTKKHFILPLNVNSTSHRQLASSRPSFVQCIGQIETAMAQLGHAGDVVPGHNCIFPSMARGNPSQPSAPAVPHAQSHPKPPRRRRSRRGH